MILVKDHQGKFCLVDSINDFLIYYNHRRHNTTQMRPFKLMTDMNDEKLLKKAKENTIKTKTKLNTEEFDVDQMLEYQIVFAF